ncbi:uncharacterized protein TM35_000152740 [Trypanosoma theileri]|uniref:PPIase cyclophilin-type domain-containing protein n=1 Tax=Trypanosoma theileri TaxID=67003 RepID=A0A1X0NWI7_9TRYP|nr:uncharacterized protein TM35_000152740 [Trypanosoma theileri]ORC88843.1 hypothetical protein TM35_000152740 [Trypanosoma theileri]
MHGKPSLPREPLEVPHRGISLTHPSNPVIFLDMLCPKRVVVANAATSGDHEEPADRFLFEIFADLAPTLAANIYSLCVGSSTRLIDQRPQPAGYKGTVIHDALVGQYLIGGDVMGSNGSGFFSALGERQGPLIVPPDELKALTEIGLSRCQHSPGIYMHYWNYTPGSVTVTPGTLKVASTLRIDVVERGVDDNKMPSDAILIGRLVCRDAESREAAKRQLMELTKAVFHAKRSGMPQLLPTILLCGEM